MTQRSAERAFVPIFTIAATLGRSVDRAALLEELTALAARDARFDFALNDHTGEVILSGIDEVQLDARVDALRPILGAETRVGPPEVAFRETITRQCTIDYTHKKQRGGAGEYARVKLLAAPHEGANGHAWQFETFAALDLPAGFVDGVRAGLQTVMQHGIVAGFPVIGVTFTLADAAWHEIDSTAGTFANAAIAAARDAFLHGGAVLLEPVVRVEVTAPDACAAQFIRDLAARGEVLTADQASSPSAIAADVPATDMLGYAASLRSLSRGQATHTSRFDHYRAVPQPDDPRFRPAAAMRAHA